VIAAAIMNACKVTNRELGELRVVINGAGAAGTATFDLLSGMGVGDIIVNDLAGILCAGQVQSPAHHVSIAAHSNRDRRQGGLAEAVRGADVFIGVQWRGNRALGQLSQNLHTTTISTGVARKIVSATISPIARPLGRV
jgi:malate dehydrogenase (oxaloacetate-decarboxylating)